MCFWPVFNEHSAPIGIGHINFKEQLLAHCFLKTNFFFKNRDENQLFSDHVLTNFLLQSKSNGETKWLQRLINLTVFRSVAMVCILHYICKSLESETSTNFKIRTK